MLDALEFGIDACRREFARRGVRRRLDLGHALGPEPIAQEACQQRQQLGLAIGLGQIGIEAQRQEAVLVARERIGSHRDDRRAPRRDEAPARIRAAAQAAQRLDAVHARHLDVHQHQVEAALAELAQALHRRAGHPHRAAQALQHLAHDLLIDRVVLDHQHLRAELRRHHLAGRPGLGAQAQDQLAQLGAAHRLVQEQIEAGVAGDACVVRRRHRRQQHLVRLPGQALLPQVLRQRDAVHVGHVPVDQQQVEGQLARALRLLAQQRQRLLAAAGQRHPQSPGAEQVVEHRAVGLVIVDHQHRQARQRGRLGRIAQGGILRRRSGSRPDLGRRAGRARCRQADRHRETKDRAQTGPALDLDGAAHQLDELTRDRQTQAGAAVAPRHALMHLGEGGEQPRHRLRRDADAGVAHLEDEVMAHTVSRIAVRGLGGRQQTQIDRHLAALGELDRVRDQIAQHLAQPQRIGTHHRRQLITGLRDQLQPLFVRTWRQQLQRVVEQRMQAELGGDQLEPAGLDLGEVQHVVDDLQQRLARAVDRLREAALAVVEPGAKQQLGHAENAVHRRADLMAHRRHELALGPAGALGGIARGLQLQLALALLGHIVEQAVDTHLAAGQLAHPGALTQPAQAVHRVVDAQRHVAGAALALEIALARQQRPVLLEHPQRQQPVGRPGRLARQAQHVEHPRADIARLRTAVAGDEDTLVDRLDQLAVALLGLAQLLRVAALLGDVAQLADQHRRTAQPVAHRDMAGAEQPLAVCAARTGKFMLDRAGAAQRTHQLRAQTLLHRRAQQLVEPPAAGLLARHRELQLGLLVQRHHTELLRIQHHQADRNVLGQHRQQRTPLVDAELALLAVGHIPADADPPRLALDRVDDDAPVDLQPVAAAGQHIVDAAQRHHLAHEVVAAQQAVAQHQRGARVLAPRAGQDLPEPPALQALRRMAAHLGKAGMHPLDPALGIGDQHALADARGQHLQPGLAPARLRQPLALAVTLGQQPERLPEPFEFQAGLGGQRARLVQLQHRHRAVGADHRQHQQSAQARRPPGHRHEGIGADPALGRRQRGQGLTEHALARRTGRQLVEIDAVLVRP